MMNFVLSIVGMSLAVALFSPKLDRRAYFFLGCWIAVCCGFYYVRH